MKSEMDSPENNPLGELAKQLREAEAAAHRERYQAAMVATSRDILLKMIERDYPATADTAYVAVELSKSFMALLGFDANGCACANCAAKKKKK